MPVILLTIVIDLIGFGIIIPILPFLVLQFGGDPVEGTLLLAVYSAMMFLGGPFWGRLADKIGRRPILIATLFGSALAYILFAFADNYWLLFLARAVSGIMAGNIVIANAMIADLTTPENRARGMGYFGAAFGVGFAIGPGLGAFLAGDPAAPDFMLPALVAAGLSLIAAIFAVFFVRESKPADELRADGTKVPAAHKPFVEFINSGPKLFLFSQFLLLNIIGSGIYGVFPFWANAVLGWGHLSVGILSAALGIVTASVQTLAIGPLTKRWGEARIFLFFITLTLAGALVISLTHTEWIFVIAFILLITGIAAGNPVVTTILSLSTPAKDQGAALGLANSAGALGRIIGPVFAGYIFLELGVDTPFLIGAGLCLICVTWASGQKTGS